MMSVYKLIPIILFLFISTMFPTSLILNVYSTSYEFNYKPVYLHSSSNTIQIANQEDPIVFKLLTYNIHFTGDADEWRDVVVEENADIVQLSETSGWTSIEDEDFQFDLDYINQNLEKLGNSPYEYYNVTYEPPTLSGGATIISRFPILSTKQIDTYHLDDGNVNEFQHPLLHSVLDINDTKVHTIGAVHLTPGETGKMQRELDIEAALNYIDDQGPVPFIFNGDFNTISPEDVGKFEWQSTNLDPGALKMVLDDNHPKTSVNHTWIDAYRTLNPRKFGYTYYYDPWENRIDYIFVNQYFFDKIIYSTAGDTPSADVGSDHYAVDVTINMNPEITDLRPPFRVHGMDADSETLSDVTISWSKNDANDTSYYNIFKDDTLKTSINETIYADTSLDENTIYKYEVSATDINNNTGAKSHPLYYKPSYGAMSTPHAPMVRGEGRSGQIYLNWTIQDNGGFEILYYMVIRATEATLEKNLFRVRTETTETEFIDDIDRIDNTYYYKVFAINQLGKGELSEIIELQPKDTTENKAFYSHIFSIFGILIISTITLKNRRNI